MVQLKFTHLAMALALVLCLLPALVAGNPVQDTRNNNPKKVVGEVNKRATASASHSKEQHLSHKTQTGTWSTNLYRSYTGTDDEERHKPHNTQKTEHHTSQHLSLSGIHSFKTHETTHDSGHYTPHSSGTFRTLTVPGSSVTSSLTVKTSHYQTNDRRSETAGLSYGREHWDHSSRPPHPTQPLTLGQSEQPQPTHPVVPHPPPHRVPPPSGFLSHKERAVDSSTTAKSSHSKHSAHRSHSPHSTHPSHSAHLTLSSHSAHSTHPSHSAHSTDLSHMAHSSHSQPSTRTLQHPPASILDAKFGKLTPPAEKRFGKLTPLAEKRFAKLTPPVEKSAAAQTGPGSIPHLLPSDNWFGPHRPTHSFPFLSLPPRPTTPFRGPPILPSESPAKREPQILPTDPHHTVLSLPSFSLPPIPTAFDDILAPARRPVTPVTDGPKPTSSAPGILVTSREQSTQCATTLWMPTSPMYRPGTRTIWTSTATLSWGAECGGCSLTVMNPFPPTTSTRHHHTKTITSKSVLTLVSPFCFANTTSTATGYTHDI